MENTTNQENANLVSLWEQMGASTGSYIGKLIGIYAEYGLEAYDQLVINPLKQFTSVASENLHYSYQPPDIRDKVWSAMGKEYGEKFGSSVGMTMDLFVNTLKNATPRAEGTSGDKNSDK